MPPKKILANRWRHLIHNLNHPECESVQQDEYEFLRAKKSLRSKFFWFKENSVGRLYLLVTEPGELAGIHKEFDLVEARALNLKTKLLVE